MKMQRSRSVKISLKTKITRFQKKSIPDGVDLLNVKTSYGEQVIELKKSRVCWFLNQIFSHCPSVMISPSHAFQTEPFINCCSHPCVSTTSLAASCTCNTQLIVPSLVLVRMSAHGKTASSRYSNLPVPPFAYCGTFPGLRFCAFCLFWGLFEQSYLCCRWWHFHMQHLWCSKGDLLPLSKPTTNTSVVQVQTFT